MPALQNPRRERFAQEFVKDLNQTKAAERAGYKCPHVKGSQLMAIPEVAARIKALQSAVAERNQVTVDEIVKNLRDSRQRAHDNKQISAAVQAEAIVAKVTGNWLDRYTDETETPDAKAAIKELAGDSVLAETALTLLFAGEVQRFERWVNSGGKLVPELVRAAK